VNLHFGKAVAIQSNTNGYVTAMNIEKGNYVQEGDILAIINNLRLVSILAAMLKNRLYYILIVTNFKF